MSEETKPTELRTTIYEDCKADGEYDPVVWRSMNVVMDCEDMNFARTRILSTMDEDDHSVICVEFYNGLPSVTIGRRDGDHPDIVVSFDGNSWVSVPVQQ